MYVDVELPTGCTNGEHGHCRCSHTFCVISQKSADSGGGLRLQANVPRRPAEELPVIEGAMDTIHHWRPSGGVVRRTSTATSSRQLPVQVRHHPRQPRTPLANHRLRTRRACTNPRSPCTSPQETTHRLVTCRLVARTTPPCSPRPSHHRWRSPVTSTTPIRTRSRGPFVVWT